MNDAVIVVQEVQCIKQLTGVMVDIDQRNWTTLEQPALQTNCYEDREGERLFHTCIKSC